jgi:hypothetical protein
MKTKLQMNQILIGVLMGILISYVTSQSYNHHVTSFLLDILPLIYFLTLLYFTSFLLIELLIYKNKTVLNTLNILEINHNRNMRCLKITMSNNNLLEGEELFKGIYTTLMKNKDFLKFGFQKIIILSVVLMSESEHNLHSNILIDNDTTFNEYYSTISHELVKYENIQYGYHNEAISNYIMLAWNVDNDKNIKIKQTYSVNKLKSKSNHNNPNFIRSYSTLNNRKWYKGLINPISLYNKKVY